MAGKRLHTAGLSSGMDDEGGISPVGGRTSRILEMELAAIKTGDSPRSQSKLEHETSFDSPSDMSGGKSPGISDDKRVGSAKRGRASALSVKSHRSGTSSVPPEMGNANNAVKVTPDVKTSPDIDDGLEAPPRGSTSQSVVSTMSSVDIPLPADSRMSQVSEVEQTEIRPPSEEIQLPVPVPIPADEGTFYCVDHGLIVQEKVYLSFLSNFIS